LDLRPLPTRYPMVLIIAQSGTERMLEQRAKELGAEIVRDAEVVGLRPDDAGVTLDIEGGRSVRARYVVGTDGAHSKVRDLIGVDFVGEQYETHIILADVMLSRPPEQTLFGAAGPKGLVLFVPFGDAWFRAIIWDRDRENVSLDEPVTLAELQESFRRIAGDDYGMQEPRWRTRFLSEHRQARHYRVGRVFLAGDAAHVHSPVGGQGMNTGIGDAFNLGWKLAKAVREGDESVLDSYEAERHPVGRSVLQLTDALFKLVLSRSALGQGAAGGDPGRAEAGAGAPAHQGTPVRHRDPLRSTAWRSSLGRAQDAGSVHKRGTALRGDARGQGVAGVQGKLQGLRPPRHRGRLGDGAQGCAGAPGRIRGLGDRMTRA